MKFCKETECRWYGESKPGGDRKCYYGDPQCWRGWADLFARLIPGLNLKRGRDSQAGPGQGLEK